MGEAVAKKENPIVALRKTLETPTVKQQFENALRDNARLFIASIMDLVSSDKSLQQCNPSDIVREALKAAVLKLPLNKQLGFAYIVPFKDHGTMKPQFILGYKGLIQLAARTGQYKYINADVVYEGEEVKRDRITGETVITGKPKSNKVIGYFAYMELNNGFKKLIYKSKDEIVKHAEKYSKSYKSEYSPWKTDFDKMAMKTVLRELIGVYGIKSVDFLAAEATDIEDFRNEEETDEQIIEVNPEPETTNKQKEVADGPGF